MSLQEKSLQNLHHSDIERIKEWNNTDVEYEHSLCIHEKFEQTVSKFPDRIAFIFRDQKVTYEDFNKHANRLAHFLIGKGAKPETLIAVCMERSPELMIGIYAILKAGAAYMPVDPNTPPDRLKHILDDGKPLLVLTSEKSEMNLPANSPERIHLDNILNEPLSVNDKNPVIGVSSKNIAYIIYTSGSTGTPKGVLIEHHSVLNRIGWMQKAYPINTNDILLQKTPVTFDVSVWELFWWGFEGATLMLLNPGDEKEPEKIAKVIEENKVTTIHFVPSMFGAFINYLDSFNESQKVSSLKKVFLSGEALPASMVNNFNQLMTGIGTKIINLYGPTEATVDVSHYLCPKTTTDIMYIGKPIDNTKLLIVNEKNEIQPIGQPGELIITGVNLARGYLNRDELNASKFIEIQYFDGQKLRGYKTGDLAKWTDSGNIFYIGRLDSQVKIRGFRIELGDIEAQISQNGAIKLCAVVVNHPNSINSQLIAYVCLKPNTYISGEELKQYLSKKLPEYMVPSAIIFLDDMPLTTSGKIDRKALPQPETIKKDLNQPSKVTHYENALTQVWKDTLKHDNFDINANFFEIGGNSILIPFVTSKLIKEHKIKLNSVDIIQYPTIKALANYLAGVGEKDDAPAENPQNKKELENILARVWKDVLNVEHINRDENFFDLGGSSILIPFVINKLFKNHNIKITNVDIIQYPTIEKLSSFLSGEKTNSPTIIPGNKQEGTKAKKVNASNEIAVIGMACRYPGANNINEYWNNLINEKNTIKYFGDEEVAEFEYDFPNLKNNPDYVKARGILEGTDKFDAPFFGMTPKEAALTDPQHKIWLETAWEALENAGCDPFAYEKSIGVFAGGYISTYLLNNVLRDPRVLENYIRLRSTDSYQILTANDPAYIATKTAYKFNLRGPAISVQTACSTSLVAIAQACQNLVDFGSDICIAGGVCIFVPQKCGYLYQEGAIVSPDGYCRPFDADAKGSVLSNGVGVVILKRLKDALRDGDHIYSVVKGWGLNNDGSNKVSFTAPSVNGQAEAINKAQEMANVSPEEISYIEAHGTGTKLGDPIEIAALKQAFLKKTTKKQYCGIGSVKSNIGHTDAAAGVASFIKVCLAAYHKKIPATINYSKPNPHIDFTNSPFYVNNKLLEWNQKKPLIMGVSSFGIGGTNAHLILEEAPVNDKDVDEKSDWPELFLFSARSAYSLTERKKDISLHLISNPEISYRSVAYTLLTGRTHMPHRGFFVASSKEDLQSENLVTNTGAVNDKISKIIFMFPGQGAQYLTMGKSLYHTNPLFRKLLDDGFELIKNETGTELKNILFDSTASPEAEKRLASTEIAQPALFLIEYALSQVLVSLGVKPTELMGHSIGEYAAACFSGVFSFSDALKIVLKRGQLMRSMPAGKMLAVKSSAENLKNLNCTYFEIAGDNAPEMCSISLKEKDLEKVKTILENANIQYIPLNTSHAFHSSDFDPILKEFANYVNQFNLKSPATPFISCLTGEYITPSEATSGKYWADQLRHTVQFRKGINCISTNEDALFVEVGPNTHLCSIVKQNQANGAKKLVVSSLGKNDSIDERFKLISVLGNCFINGILPDVKALFKEPVPKKITLPTYPFERKRYWIDYKPSQNITAPITSEGIAYSSSVEEEITDIGASDIVEEKVRQIWKAMIGGENIGLDEDFTDLGGHSLLALQINNRIKETLKVEISLKEFLENPTIRKVSNLVKTKGGFADQSAASENLIISHSFNKGNLPLTSNQQRLWLISKLDPDIASYIVSDSFRFTGKLNKEIFHNSLEKLFERHHIVFSIFKEENGEPYCNIVPSKVELNYLDYSNLEYEAKMSKINELILSDSKKVFDLENGPLYRLYLVKSTENEYYFHFSIHHIVFDGWSWSVFAKDLSEIYNSLIKGKNPNLPSLDFQQYDYAFWEKGPEGLKIEEKSKQFWKDYLKESNTIIDFPFDYVRKEKPTGRGNYVNVSISPETTQKLKQLSKKEGASLFTTLISAYGIQMHKYSGQSDINIGLPVAYRPHSKLENIFGMFVNTVVIRLRCEKDQTFEEIIRSSNQSALDAIDHQDLAFDKVVEIINPERSPNINPLFQVAFAWQNNLDEPFALEGISYKKLEKTERATEFDITLSLWENGNIIEGTFEYNLDVLKHESVIRLKDNFLNLLHQLVERYDTKVGSISMITANELKLIDTFNQTSSDYPKNKTIVRLFEEQVKLFPEKIAAVFNESHLSYYELNCKANQLARTLRLKGVKPNTPVGIFVDKSIDMIVGIFGILKAGGAYVPIDPEYPDQRVSFVINDSGCKVILTQKRYNHLPFEGIVKLNLESGETFHSDASDVEPINSPEDLAYIIYTSGTTGTPKGTLIPHKGVVRLVKNTNYIEFTPNDRVLQTSSIVFDASTEEIFGALLNGSSLFIIDKHTVLDPNSFGTILSKHNITIVDLSSALFTQIAEVRPDIFKDVKKLILGGDVISPPHVNKVRKENPGIAIINTYGPTENSCNSTGFLIDKDFEYNIPIGKPISNSTAYIFDNNMSYQPVGIIGELYVGGDGLSKGYLNRDDLNKTSFIYNPYNPEERLYKTGDRARWLPDGNIEFHGRVDNQIKIRGYRVELEEIEAVISSMEGVIEAVVKPVKLEDGDYKLVAFLNIKDSFTADAAQLTSQIKSKLPPYMVPSAFKFLKGFPKNVNGKIDRKALHFDINEFGGEKLPDKNTLTATESVLLNIWCEILKLKNITVTDNFFEIGGNSLLTISMAAKIEKTFQVEFNIRSVFSTPTIKDLAELIDLKSSSKLLEKIKTNSNSGKIITGEI